MDIQLIIVILIFAMAVFFIVRRIYLQMKGKKSAGCDNCGVTEKQLK
jgi:preprotein translocase subunit YajC